MTYPDHGEELVGLLESAKWYLLHGNTKESLKHLDEAYYLCYCEKLRYRKHRIKTFGAHIHKTVPILMMAVK